MSFSPWLCAIMGTVSILSFISFFLALALFQPHPNSSVNHGKTFSLGLAIISVYDNRRN